MNKKELKKQQRAENLQRLYTEGKLMSTEFYKEVTNQIKYYLMIFLIKKGYYKNGVAQCNFNQEDIDDCYTYVMSHLVGTYITKNGKRSFVKYDPEKGSIVGFIRGWCKGYSSSILMKQRKEHKYSAHKILILDDVLISHTPNNFIEDDVYDCIEEERDRELFSRKIITEGFKAEPKERFSMNKFNEFTSPYEESNIRRKLI
jgi:hypothetical protein